MNNTLLALLVGLVAGAAGAFTVNLVDGRSAGGSTVSVSESGSLEARLAAIEQSLRALANPPATLTTRAASPGGGGAAVLGAEGVEELLARIDERVGKTVESRLEALKPGDGAEKAEGRGRRGRKRVDLADAARELELTARQEDELRRIFEENQAKVFKLLAEPDGDPEEVRREVMEAVQNPAGARRLMGRYMPKFISKLGDIMLLQAERDTAIRAAVGPEKARRIENEYSIKEDDLLGMRAGMQMEVQADPRGN